MVLDELSRSHLVGTLKSNFFLQITTEKYKDLSGDMPVEIKQSAKVVLRQMALLDTSYSNTI